MDIEGFVRARIDDYDYNDLTELLAVRIREYKKISEIVEANENKLNGYTKFEAEFFIWDYEQLQLLIESLKKVRKSYKEHENSNLKAIASITEKYINDMKEISEQLITF